MRYDLCVVGHITEDRIEIAGHNARTQPGGMAYYASIAASRLGAKVAVVTKMKASDRSRLLGTLGTLPIDVFWHESLETTRFVNRYADAEADVRRQEVASVADAFVADELEIDAAMYLFGPLTQTEIPLECLTSSAQRGVRVALDLQGLIRDVQDGRVVNAPAPALAEYLRLVGIIKAGRDDLAFMGNEASDEDAARTIAGMGPDEVVITAGSLGSCVLGAGQIHEIPANRPDRYVDTTGCGDTYFGAYLTRRLTADTPEAAGRFAAAVAGAKISYFGAFRGAVQDGLALPNTLVKRSRE